MSLVISRYSSVRHIYRLRDARGPEFCAGQRHCFFDLVHRYASWRNPYIATDNALDPEKYFIVVPDMFTNGYSSSPSNAAAQHAGLQLPHVTPYDNVVAQHILLEEQFEVSRIELMAGFSMSGQQAHRWAALHSDFVKRAYAI